MNRNMYHCVLQGKKQPFNHPQRYPVPVRNSDKKWLLYQLHLLMPVMILLSRAFENVVKCIGALN